MNFQPTIGVLIIVIFSVIIIIHGKTSPSPSTEHVHDDPRHRTCSTGENITVITMEKPPYVLYKNTSVPGLNQAGAFVDFFISAIRMCYQYCNVTFKAANSSKDLINMIQRNQGNIAFPITSSLTVNLTWPWYKREAIFLHPAIVSDSRTVIINKHHFNQWIRSKMLESLLQAWPLFAFTFVLAGLSGVCIWCLEWRTNSKEFNRSFTRGWFEGFWWAFVSMTTVGYGDKTPKTILGRLFAAVWILFGLVMVAVFTATATSAMTSFESGIAQARVAVLSSTEASLYAAKQGASVQKFESFNAMYKALQARQVDAILVDHYVGAYHVSKLSHDDLRMLTTKISQARYSMAFIDKESQFIYSECFKTLDTKQGTSYFLEKHATVLKAFDYSSDFGGLFGNEGNSNFMILISSIALGAVLLIGISLEYIHSKFKLNRWWCTKCCNTRTMVRELNNMKTFSNDKKEEMPTTRRIYPSPFEVKPNADHSLETLTNEVQRLRITMNQVLEKLNG